MRLLLLPCLLLAGCAHDNAPPIEIKVPVPVPCVSAEFPKPPTYPDTRKALRHARLKALEAALEPCRKTP